MDLIDRNELIKKLTDRHSKHYVNWKAFKNYMGERKVIHHTEMDECKEIIDIIIEQPTVEAVPMVYLDVEKSEILDTLDKMQFFLGQRAGRELWNDKPEDIQEKDLENFNRDIQKIKEYLFKEELIRKANTRKPMQKIMKKLEAEDYKKDGGELFLNHNLEDCIPLRRVYEIIKEEGGMHDNT